MSARVPIVLALVAALLLIYILAFERGRPSATEVESRSGLLVERLIRDRITAIRIATGDARALLRREGEGFDETWTLEEPRRSPADPEQVEDYVRNWEFSIPVRTLESPSDEDRREFGMDSPRGEVTFEMDRAEVRITLGSGTPVDGGGYVRIDDHPAIVVVGQEVVELFDRGWEEFAVKDDAGAPLLEDLEALEDANSE